MCPQCKQEALQILKAENACAGSPWKEIGVLRTLRIVLLTWRYPLRVHRSAMNGFRKSLIEKLEKK